MHKQIILLAFLSFLSVCANANYYAYIPDNTGLDQGQTHADRIFVFNTRDHVIVNTIPTFGRPRDVAISPDGSTVYFSTIDKPDQPNNSYINILNTHTLENPRPIRVTDQTNVRGMAISQDNTTLYVTHANGVTRIKAPLVTDEQATIQTLYRGKTLILSDDGKYLFVLGQDDAFNFGVSVVATDTFTEVKDYAIGQNTDSNAIIYHNTLQKLFIANQATNEVVSLQLNNYDDENNVTLTEINRVQFPDKYGPTAFTLIEATNELYVAVSMSGYTFEDTSTANSPLKEGYVALLDARDINHTVKEIALSDEESTYTDIVNIHPVSLGKTPTGAVFLLKQLWGDRAGLYISWLRKTISGNNVYFSEINSTLIGKTVTIYSNGNFIGPDCTACPTGVDDTVARNRSAALNPHLFLFFAIVALLRIYYSKNETYRARS